jgi:hypothetical protein
MDAVGVEDQMVGTSAVHARQLQGKPVCACTTTRLGLTHVSDRYTEAQYFALVCVLTATACLHTHGLLLCLGNVAAVHAAQRSARAVPAAAGSTAATTPQHGAAAV